MCFGWRKLLHVIILLLFIPFTSLRTIYKHFPQPLELSFAFLILWGIAIYIVLTPNFIKRVKKYFDNPVIFFIMLGVSIAARLLLYPLVDGIGFGATGDDAFFLPINRLLNIERPYEIKLYDGAPISPGMGWLLINFPFGVSDLFPYLVPIYLGFTAYALNKYFKSWLLVNLVIAIFMSTTIFWTLLGSGHDLVAVALTIIISFITVELHITSSRKWYLVAIMVGCFSTSRIVFIALPFLFMVLLFRYHRLYAIKFFCLSLSFTILFHLVGYIISDWYQPFHLIYRGFNNIGTGVILIGSVFLIFAVIFMYSYVGKTIYSRLIFYALIIGILFSIIAIGELRSVGYDFSRWEGLSYLYVASPIVVLAVISKHFKVDVAEIERFNKE